MRQHTHPASHKNSALRVSLFCFMATGIHYNQPQISVEEQIATLKNDGLVFMDEGKAKHLLNNISLFRMKSYLHPFRKAGERSFKQGVTFEQAYSLYKFDSELRKLICSELEKIEVSIRTQLSYIQTAHSDIFWFADSANFTQSSLHNTLVAKLRRELDRSDDDQVVEFRHRYNDPFPPSWITMEVTSFGTLSTLYKGLKNGRGKRALANYYGLSDTVMESWLHAIVYVRNICAHHSRLWNKNLRIRPLVPRRTTHPFLSNPTHNNRTFYVLSIILYFLKTVNPQNTLAERVRLLLDKYPSVDYIAMGFPHNWEQESLWR